MITTALAAAILLLLPFLVLLEVLAGRRRRRDIDSIIAIVRERARLLEELDLELLQQESRQERTFAAVSRLLPTLEHWLRPVVYTLWASRTVSRLKYHPPERFRFDIPRSILMTGTPKSKFGSEVKDLVRIWAEPMRIEPKIGVFESDIPNWPDLMTGTFRWKVGSELFLEMWTEPSAAEEEESIN